LAATSTTTATADSAAAQIAPTTQWTIQNETSSTLTQTQIRTHDPYNQIIKDWEHGVGHAPDTTINSAASTDLKFVNFSIVHEFVQLTYVTEDGRSITIRLGDDDLTVWEANGLTATAEGTSGLNSEYTVTIR